MPAIIKRENDSATSGPSRAPDSAEFVPADKGAAVSDSNGNGPNGGDFSDFGDWDDGPHDNDGRQPEYWFTPRGAYRAGVFWAIASIASLFAATSTIVETTWAHSKKWVPTPLPRILYLNTGILLISSITAALAQHWSVKGSRARSRFALQGTLVLGCFFLGGQIIAWRDLASQGIYLASNAGSLFFYVITAMHAIHLAVGILALVYVIVRSNHLQGAGLEQAAVESIALYWHFMDGLWVYVLVLLLVSVR